jgi:hypothetical protein
MHLGESELRGVSGSARLGSDRDATRAVIIVGLDDLAETEAAAAWPDREAVRRKHDLLLVHTYEVSIPPPRGMAAAICHHGHCIDDPPSLDMTTYEPADIEPSVV